MNSAPSNTSLNTTTTSTTTASSKSNGQLASVPPNASSQQRLVASDDEDPIALLRRRVLKDFELTRQLGEGSFSVVMAGRELSTGKEYAVKILEKRHIVKEKKVKYVQIERDVLNKLRHSFIIRLFYTFQDASSLCELSVQVDNISNDGKLDFVLELAEHGELLGFIKKLGSLNMEVVQFYAAEMVVAVEYLHSQGILHRDLKPENILLDSNMHIRITDFGSAKDLNRPPEPIPSPRTPDTRTSGGSLQSMSRERACSFVGTAEYVSPELLGEREAGKESDLWALGCIVFQMIAGRPPFKGSNEYQTFQKIIKLQYQFPEQGFTPEARSFVEALLVLDPEKRLGHGGFGEIKSHPFFHGIEWDHYQTWVPPPMLPGTAPPVSSTESIHTKSSPSRTLSPVRQDESPWTKFLYKNENIFYSGSVLKRKGLFSKKRYLILTDKPRLLYIDENKMKEKGEIPWSDHMSLELKDERQFLIRIPKRTYVLEDLNGSARQWIDAIQSLLHSTS